MEQEHIYTKYETTLSYRVQMCRRVLIIFLQREAINHKFTFGQYT